MTVTVAVAELFAGVGSLVSALEVAVLEMTVPPAVLPDTATTIVKLAVSAFATDALVNVSVPVPPTATESVRVHPAGTVVDTNVVFAGIGSLRTAFTAV